MRRTWWDALFGYLFGKALMRYLEDHGALYNKRAHQAQLNNNIRMHRNVWDKIRQMEGNTRPLDTTEPANPLDPAVSGKIWCVDK